jgi:magnesium transporter
MVNWFEIIDGRLSQGKADVLAPLKAPVADSLTAPLTSPMTARPVWVDFVAPTQAERRWARDTFDMVLPDEEDFGDIEVSARVSQHREHIHVTNPCDNVSWRLSVVVALVDVSARV